MLVDCVNFAQLWVLFFWGSSLKLRLRGRVLARRLFYECLSHLKSIIYLTLLNIASRCIPAAVEPCSLRLCEQACEVRDERLWCSCHQGFIFNEENYRRKQQPYCVGMSRFHVILVITAVIA